MARLLFTVEDTFLIQGRGLVPVPGITPVSDERINVGDNILIRRPDGTEFPWKIGGIEFITPQPKTFDVVILLKDLTKDDVPIGSEVWSVDS